MNGKECRAMRREIDESELNQRLSNQALSHLSACSACRDFRAERASLRELVGSLEPVAAPGDFDLRLRARIAKEGSQARQPFIFRFVTSTPALIAAALVVMLATSLVWFAQRNKGQQAPAIAATAPPVGPAVSSTGSEPAGLASNATATLGTAPDADTESKSGGQSRGINSSRENNSKAALASSASTDYAVSKAESIKQLEQRAGEVSLSAPHRPLVVSMQDDRGATRKISLPPVTFGAQRLVDNRIPLSSTNSRSW